MKKLSLFSLLGASFVLSGCGIKAHDQMAWCDVEEQVSEKINLSADALFAFDKSNTQDLLEKGKRTLDELADKVSHQYVQVDNINLVGHTDCLGSERYNYQLGLNRAETVKSYLQNKGITAPISVASAGKLNLSAIVKVIRLPLN